MIVDFNTRTSGLLSVFNFSAYLFIPQVRINELADYEASTKVCHVLPSLQNVPLHYGSDIKSAIRYLWVAVIE
jgi:hypothetical protein